METTPESGGGRLVIDSTSVSVELERVGILSGVTIADSFFQARTGPVRAPLEKAARFGPLLEPGTDTWLLAYRNFAGFCCDGHFPASFIFLAAFVDGKPDPRKSFISFFEGEGGWILRPERIEQSDSAIEIRAVFDHDSTVVRIAGRFRMGRPIVPDEFRKSFERVRKRLD